MSHMYVDNYPIPPNPQSYQQPLPNYGAHQYPHIEPQVSLTCSYILWLHLCMSIYIMQVNYIHMCVCVFMYVYNIMTKVCRG